MKSLSIYLCFSLEMICLINALSGDRGHCYWLRHRNPIILSIFNLKDDIIIQMSYQYSQISHFWKFWRLWATDPRDFTKSVSRNLKLYDYYESPFLPVPEGTQNESHKIVDNIYGFDEKKPIFGYMSPLYKRDYDDCGHPDPPLACKEMQTILFDENKEFICIHGTIDGKFGTKPFVFNTTDGQLYRIRDTELSDRVTNSCIINTNFYQNLTKNGHKMVSLANWADVSMINRVLISDFSNISIVEPIDQNSNTTSIAYIYGFNKTITHWKRIPGKRYNSIFRFNSYYQYLLCEEDCHIDSPLLWLNITDSGIDVKETEIPITLAKLIGCAPVGTTDKSAEVMDPNQFCGESKRKFLSVFSLRKDIYFQSEGLFWHYPYNRFEEYRNQTRNYKIRVESDFTALLESSDFDTTLPVVGFSFVTPISDDCETSDTECHKRYFQSEQTHRVCLFGKRTANFSKSESVDHRKAFYYNPSGLTSLRPISGEYQDQFCDLFNKKGMGLNSITSYGVDYVSGNYIVFGIYRYLGLLTWIWPFKRLPTKDLVHFYKPNQQSSHETNRFCLFSFHRSESGIELTDWFALQYTVEDEVRKTDDQLYPLKYNHMDYQNLSIESNSSAKIFYLFNCPFNTTVSLVTNRREEVCPEQKTNSVQSVFSIGIRLYHQIGQRFYFFDNKRKQFLYDKHLSDVLDVYFDTRHRVTGYSYFNQTKSLNNIIEVMIHGKSGQDYEFLGKYISALFYINGSVPFLHVMNDTNLSVLSPNVTLGKVYYPRNISEDLFIDHMSGVVGHKRFIWLWIQSVNDSFKIVREDETDKRLYRLGTQPKIASNNWKIQIYPKRDIRSQPILGIYSDVRHEYLLLVAYQSLNERKIYKMSEVFRGSGGGYSYFWLPLSNLTMYKDYDNTFCRIEPKSEAIDWLETWTPNTLSYIFAVLLLILLVLAIITAFLTYKKNKRKTESTKPKSNAILAQTLSPNRLNYTVIRQTEPNADNLEVNDINPENEWSPKTVRSEQI